ncbi:permease [Clostridium thermarum]|uniref:permease n=1 Tax=Clostridium thermarum TaxID=1716543 RepID=UPI0013D4BFE4|nr:permease [Clostridium thermarum]
MLRQLKKYSFFIVSMILALILLVLDRKSGTKAFSIVRDSFMQMLQVLPPIMIMLGLMDVWVSREKMMKYMGHNSGMLGIILAIIIGTIGAGPMYASFPFTAVLIKKGVRFSNIIIFMNAWCVLKVSTVLFEISSLGYEFTILRFAVDLPGIIIMGFIVERLMGKEELLRLYSNEE